MKNFSVTKNYKLWIIITLAVIVVGFLFLGIFGFNQTVDYTKSYEVNVSVEESIGKSFDVMKQTTEKYFGEKGVKAVAYTNQESKEAGVLIYKFSGDVSDKIDAAELENKIETAFIGDAVIEGLEVSVKTYSTLNSFVKQTGWIILGACLIVVATFVYMLFLEKFAGAITLLAVSIIAGLLNMALIALFRIPALPVLESVVAFAVTLTAIISAGIVNRYREEKKNVGNEKLSDTEIADNVATLNFNKLCIILGALVVLAIFLAIVGTGYLKFIGLQLVISGIVSVFTAFVWNPLVWSFVKKDKKDYKVSSKQAE